MTHDSGNCHVQRERGQAVARRAARRLLRKAVVVRDLAHRDRRQQQRVEAEEDIREAHLGRVVVVPRVLVADARRRVQGDGVR